VSAIETTDRDGNAVLLRPVHVRLSDIVTIYAVMIPATTREGNR
jgi:hypothetical protein